MQEKVFDNSKFKRLRNLLGLNQTEFANELNSRQQIIAMVENNKRAIPSSIRVNFYNKFKIGLEEACEYTTSEALNVALNRKTITDHLEGTENIVQLPVHDIGAAAGAGTWLGDEPETDSMFFDKRFLKQILRTDNYSSLHIIHATGDSMDSGWNQPDDIKDGDLLMVDTSKTTGNNQIFVIMVNNSELRVKRLFKRGDVLYISSNNPKYEEETYYTNNPDIEIKVIGRVVWNGSKENI